MNSFELQKQMALVEYEWMPTTYVPSRTSSLASLKSLVCVPLDSCPLSCPSTIGTQAERWGSGAQTMVTAITVPYPTLRSHSFSILTSIHLWVELVTSPTDPVPLGLFSVQGHMNVDQWKDQNVLNSVIHINQGSCLINNSKLLQIHKSFSHCLLAVSSP